MYTMRLKPIHIALILFLFLGIVMFTGGSTYVPYSKDMLFSKMYKYEGMEGNSDQPPSNELSIPPPSNFPSPSTMPPPPPYPPIPPSSTPGMPPVKIPYTPDPSENKKEKEKMVEGFALHPSPLTENTILNPFGDTPSGLQCFGQSSGYSNSLGPLCFTSSDLKWFASRGGNATGGESTIG